MRIGSLVKFSESYPRSWGLGLILHKYDDKHKRLDSVYSGYYYALTQLGQKLVSDSFMEELSVEPISS